MKQEFAINKDSMKLKLAMTQTSIKEESITMKKEIVLSRESMKEELDKNKNEMR